MLKQRVITAVILLAILLPALFWRTPEPFLLITLVLIAAGGWEWGRLNGLGQGANIALGVVTDGVYLNGGSIQLTTGFAAGGGVEYFWTRNFSSTIYGGYSRYEYNNTVVSGRYFCGGVPGATARIQNVTVAATVTCDPSYSLWQIGTHQDWFPAAGWRLAVDLLYTRVETAFDGQQVALKAVNARPAGAYTAKDLGLTSVMFRAERSWGN